MVKNLRRTKIRRVSESKQTVDLEGRCTEVVFRQSSQARALRLKVDSGGVSVSAPLWVARKHMLHYLQAEAAWVLRQLAAVREREETVARHRCSMRGKLFFRGRTYPITWVQQEARKRPRFRLCDGQLVVESAARDAELVNAWVRWLKREASECFKARVEYFSKKMKLYPERISVRDQKSKWGACINRKTVSFNARLILASPQVLDYVVIHELAHIRYMTHGQRFWSLVKKHCPEYNDYRKWLGIYGWMLQWPTLDSLPEKEDRDVLDRGDERQIVFEELVPVL